MDSDLNSKRLRSPSKLSLLRGFLLAGFALVYGNVITANAASGPPQSPIPTANPAANSEAYDVFVLAPAEVEALVSQAGSEISKLGLESLYRKGFLPHVTLYLTRYDPADLTEIRMRVRELASQIHPFGLLATGCSLTPSHWLFLDVKPDSKLQALSDLAVMRLSPLHDPKLPEPAWLKDVPHKREAFQRFGSPNVFGAFEPHLTQLAHEPSPKLSEWFATGACHHWQASGQVLAIGMAPVDADGQILRGRAEIFPLARQ